MTVVALPAESRMTAAGCLLTISMEKDDPDAMRRVELNLKWNS